MERMVKDKWLRVRLSNQEEQILNSWAIAYGENKSSFLRRLLRSLPEPDSLPQPLTRTLQEQLLGQAQAKAAAQRAKAAACPLTE